MCCKLNWIIRNMFKKIKILSVMFFMLFSNVAFSATSFYSFVEKFNIENEVNKIDIVKQYRGIVNMPKVFCDICVELTEEIISISNKDKNNSNLNCEYTYNDNVIGNIKAIQNNNKKQTNTFFANKINSILKDKPDKLWVRSNETIIYYITSYIGLLRANDVINNNISIINTGKTLLFI